MCSELVEREVGEAVDTVEDPQQHQGLHCVQIKLREAKVQVQQSLPKERVKRRLEPLEEEVPVHGHMTGGRSGWLIGWLRESKLHIIRDLIKFPDQIHLSFCYLGQVPVHLEP